MANTSFSFDWVSTNDAEVRAWVNQFITMLNTIGLTQTADTGQIDPNTITYAVNANYGYVIYRFNDALQATAPIFLRIEFHQGAANSRPAVYFFLGSATNGAGALTNSTAVAVNAKASTISIGLRTTYAAYTGGALAISWCGGPGNDGLFFCLERTAGNNGSYTNEGCAAFSSFDGSSTHCASVLFSMWQTLVRLSVNSYGGMVFQPAPTQTGSNIQAGEVSSVWTRLPGQRPRPFLHFMWVGNSQMSQGETALIQAFDGVTDLAFISAGNGQYFVDSAAAASLNSQILIPWE